MYELIACCLGSEVLSTELRVCTCLELSTRRDSYLSHPLASQIGLLSPDFDTAEYKFNFFN